MQDKEGIKCVRYTPCLRKAANFNVSELRPISINLRTVGRKMMKIAEILCYIYFSPHFTDMSPQYLVMTDLLKHIRIIIGVRNVPRHANTSAETTTPLA